MKAKLFANLLVEAGSSSRSMQGFFDIPVDLLSGRLLLLKQIYGIQASDCIVAPDIESVKMRERLQITCKV